MTFEQYEQEVKRHLTDKRFFHSQCVAAEAARLPSAMAPTWKRPGWRASSTIL